MFGLDVLHDYDLVLRPLNDEGILLSRDTAGMVCITDISFKDKFLFLLIINIIQL